MPAYSEHAGFITQIFVIYLMLLKLLQKGKHVFLEKFLENLSQKSVSNTAVEKFFYAFDYIKV